MTDNPPDNSRHSTGYGRSAIGGAMITVLGQVFRFSVQFASLILLSRLLMPKTFGLMAMLAPIMTFAALFSDLGLTQATVTARSINSQQMSGLFWINVLVGLSLGLLIAAIAPLIGWFYNEQAIVWPLVILSATLPLASLGSQHSALASRQLRFHSLALVDAISLAIGTTASFLYALYSPTIWALVIGALFTVLPAVIGYWVISPWRPVIALTFHEIRPLLRYGRGLVGFNLFNFFSRNADNVLIGARLGAVPLGLYDRAYKLILLPLSQINGPVGKVLVPILSRMVDHPDRYRRAYLQTIRLLLLLTLPLIAFLIGNASVVIPALLGEQWRDSVPIFLWLGFAAVHQPLSTTTGWLFISQSRTDEFAKWGLYVAITSVLAFVVGLPWGVQGVAAAYGLSDLFVRAPVVWWLIGRRGPIQAADFVSIAWRHGLAVIAIILIQGPMRKLLIDFLPISDLLIQGVVSLGFYVVFIVIIDRATRESLGSAITFCRSKTLD